VITYAALLPITTLLFSLNPLMGAYTEPLQATTPVGLLVVVLGFYLYHEHVLGLKKRRTTEEGVVGVRVPSFQERVVAGLGPAIFQQPHGHWQYSTHHHATTTMVDAASTA